MCCQNVGKEFREGFAYKPRSKSNLTSTRSSCNTPKSWKSSYPVTSNSHALHANCKTLLCAEGPGSTCARVLASCWASALKRANAPNKGGAYRSCTRCSSTHFDAFTTFAYWTGNNITGATNRLEVVNIFDFDSGEDGT